MRAFVPLRNPTTQRTESISPTTSISLGSVWVLMLVHYLIVGSMVLYFQHFCGYSAVANPAFNPDAQNAASRRHGRRVPPPYAI